MSDNQRQSGGNDEIDISQIFHWIGNGFRNFGNTILFSLAGLRQTFFDYKIFFAITILAGLSFGWFYSEGLSKKYYKSTMILSCDYLNRQIVENTIQKLNLLCGEPERVGLSEELGIDIGTAKNIQKFESKSFISETDIVELEVLKEQLSNVAAEKKDLVKKVIDKLELDNKAAFQISVLIYDPSIVRNLDSAVTKYFRNNDYVKKRIEITKTNLLLKKKKLVSESNKLDSLKLVLFKNFESMAAAQAKQGSNNVILNDKIIADPISVYREDAIFYNEIQDIDRLLYIQPDFEVIDGFTSFKEPESASLLQVLILAFFVSIITGYVILGAWKFDRFLSKLSKQAT